jgi:hypothetical protein
MFVLLPLMLVAPRCGGCFVLCSWHLLVVLQCCIPALLQVFCLRCMLQLLTSSDDHASASTPMLQRAVCRDPEDREIQRELLTLKRVQKEEQKATASLFKGSLGPPPKPKPGGGLNDMEPPQQEQPAAAEPAAAAEEPPAAKEPAAARRAEAARVVSSSNSSSEGGAFLQPLFALIAVLLSWLGRLLGIKRASEARAVSR